MIKTWIIYYKKIIMETSNTMTHYEYTRMRGIRLQQLEDGIPPFVEFEINDTNVDIFNREVKEKKLPFTFIRTLSKSNKIKVSAEDMNIDVDSKM